MYSPVHQREFKERLLELTVWDQARVREEESQFLGEVRTWTTRWSSSPRGTSATHCVESSAGGTSRSAMLRPGYAPPSGSGRTGLSSAGRPASLVQAAAPRRLLSAAAQRLPLPAEESTAARRHAGQQEAAEYGTHTQTRARRHAHATAYCIIICFLLIFFCISSIILTRQRSVL